MGGDVEVIALPERVRGGPGGYGAEVGHEAEDALRLLVLQRDGIAVGVAIGLGCRWRGGGALSGGGSEEKLRGRVGEDRTGRGLGDRASRGEEQTESEQWFQEGRPIRSGVGRQYLYFRRWAVAQGSELLPEDQRVERPGCFGRILRAFGTLDGQSTAGSILTVTPPGPRSTVDDCKYVSQFSPESPPWKNLKHLRLLLLPPRSPRD